jgi:hypothetical protein
VEAHVEIILHMRGSLLRAHETEIFMHDLTILGTRSGKVSELVVAARTQWTATVIAASKTPTKVDFRCLAADAEQPDTHLHHPVAQRRLMRSRYVTSPQGTCRKAWIIPCHYAHTNSDWS